MGLPDVFAIVVTFHPDAEVEHNLAAVRAQAETLLVVDNGSNDAELVRLRELAQRLRFELIENGQNLGIATALNIGVRRAMELAARSPDRGWALLFDQDSSVTEGFAETMLGCFAAAPPGLGLLVPRYRDKRTGAEIPQERLAGRELQVAMTSGSLLKLRTFAEQGMFADELFIDGVDHEYCLRLRRAGLRVEECAQAVLLHSPGSPRLHSWLGWKFQTANYSPARRYFQERNKIWMYRRYAKVFPRYCGRLMLVSVKDFAKLVLVEADKVAKIGGFLRGLLDGVRGRMGPMG